MASLYGKAYFQAPNESTEFVLHTGKKLPIKGFFAAKNLNFIKWLHYNCNYHLKVKWAEEHLTTALGGGGGGGGGKREFNFSILLLYTYSM